MRVTMADIARECGVTKMTVSRVLAGGEKVKEATRQRVLAAAERLNYEVNSLAQNLMQDRSGFVGVATPFEGLLGTSYFKEAFRGFTEVLGNAELDFALFDINSASFNDGEKLNRLYRQRRVDGLLVVAPHIDDRFLKTLGPTGVPMIIVGEQPPISGISSVSCDNSRGITLLADYLYSQGHRQIAFVGGPSDIAAAIRREQAYDEFCRERGLKLPQTYRQPGSFTMESGLAAGRRLLRSRPRPTAIIAANDNMALGLIESIHEMGLRIPQDISIAGFDDLDSAIKGFYSLTTVHQPVFEMAELSARKLFAAIKDNETPTGQTVMEVSLEVRDSTGPPPVK